MKLWEVAELPSWSAPRWTWTWWTLVLCSSVLPATADGKLDATALNDTNRLELRVFANEAHRHAVLIARLDNLGKGASGAAVQNLQLMLGL